MKKLYAALLLLFPMFLAAPGVGKAQDELDTWYGINDLNRAGARLQGDVDLRQAIAGIINLVLGFLGVIAVVIVLIGGFKWMTSQGNSDKIDEAKKLIGAGVVGIAIVLASYAIARFVLEELYGALEPQA